MTAWADIRASWSDGWRALADHTASVHEAAIRLNPLVYSDRLSGFVSALTDSRRNLDALRAKLPNPPATEEDRQLVAGVDAMERRYADLAAGFYADSMPADQAPSGVPVVGVAPVVIVAGVAVGVVAIAWAVAAYEYAVNLREQTALADRELAARVEASRQGRSLPPSTLPPPPPSPVEGAQSAGLWLLGGLALAAGALTLPVLLRK